jgi:thioredoxin 1
VLVLDVREDPEAAAKNGIRLIPTQIFFDAAGKELWRHEGFIDKAAILARWAELGVALPGAAPAALPAAEPAG